ncbi:SprB repeat-containing protein [Candidatus Dependentiae bacterium]|nr:SprB repeat-containing protein [Candidatus Dependentiae bacterium]
MKNTLLSLLVLSLSSWYCFAALPLRITRIEEQSVGCPRGPGRESLGSVQIRLAGGTLPYRYTIDGINFSPIQDSLLLFTGLQGTYTFTILDSSLPTPLATAATVTIGPRQPLAVTSLIVENISCSNRGATGSIRVITEGGIPPIEYKIDDRPTTNIATFTNLAPGRHLIEVSSADFCPPIRVGAEITAPPALRVGTEVVAPTCNGGTDGSIQFVADGGVPPFEYSLNGVDFQPTGTFTGLAAGTYSIIIRDANNCVYTFPGVVVDQQTTFVITDVFLTNPTGNGLSNGSVIVTVNTPGSGVTYSINGGPAQVSPIFNGLPAGTYVVRAESLSGTLFFCAVRTVTLGQPDLFDFTTNIIEQPTCPSDGTAGTLGSFRVNATGGVPPYRYSLNNGATFQQSPVFTNVVAGRYSVVVRDANNTTVTRLVNIGTVIAPTGNPIVDFIIGKYCSPCAAIAR